MIKNVSKGTILADRFEVARTFWEQFLGLMFRKIKPIVFEFNNQVKKSFHTWFVKEPIDIVFLDEEWEVVEIVQNLLPRSLYKPKTGFMFAIELPAGTAFSTSTEEGDLMHIIR